MNKYEQLIEAIVNEDEATAKALFHQIVVEKSRDIYESLLDTQDIEEIEDDIEDDEVAESIRSVVTATEARQLMDYLDSGLTESVDAALLDKVSSFYGVGINEGLEDALDADSDELLDVAYGDAEADESELDTDDGEEGFEDGVEGDEVDLEGEVIDLRDELEDLKAQFDELLAANGDEESDEEVAADAGEEGSDFDADEDGDESDADSETDVDAEVKTEAKSRDNVDIMREYVEKITAGHGAEKKGSAEGQEVGNGAGAPVNKQSTVAKPNRMGGTASNIVRGGDEKAPDGQTPNGKAGGFVKAPKQIDVATKNVNKVGGNAGAQNFYKDKAAAKKGEGQTTNGTVPVKKDSLEPGSK